MAVYRADYAKVFLSRYETAMNEVIYRSTQSNWMDLDDIGNRIKAMLSYRQDNADKLTSQYGRQLAIADLKYVRQLYQGWINLHVLRLQAQPNPYTSKDIYLGVWVSGVGPGDFSEGIGAINLYNKLYNKNIKYDKEGIQQFRVIKSQLYHGYFMFIDQADRDIMIELEKQEFKARQQGGPGILGFESQDADLGFFQAVQYTGVAVLFGYVGYAAIAGGSAAGVSEGVASAAAENAGAAAATTASTSVTGAATSSGELLGQSGLLLGEGGGITVTASEGAAVTGGGGFFSGLVNVAQQAATAAVGQAAVQQVSNVLNPKKTPLTNVTTQPTSVTTQPTSETSSKNILYAVLGAVGLGLLLFI